MSKSVPKLKDVARLAGVSQSTVSRILAAPQGSSLPFAPGTCEKVKAAADMLSYSPSKLARGLIRSRTGIVGLVIPSVRDSFFPCVTSVIEEMLTQEGYNVILCNTQGSSGVERAKIDDLLAWRVDGLVIAPSQETLDASVFWKLWERKVPFVLVDRSYPDTPFATVTTDDYRGAHLAVEHLLRCGRRRIARAGGPLTVSTNRQRHRGYAEALVRNGLAARDDYSIEVPPTEEGGTLAVERLLALKPRPDALFCFNDPVAAGVLQAWLEQGLRIPQDLALVGYCDLTYAKMLRVPLTTIRQPQDLLARTAFEMLLGQMQGLPLQTSQVTLPVELVIRESTAAERT